MTAVLERPAPAAELASSRTAAVVSALAWRRWATFRKQLRKPWLAIGLVIAVAIVIAVLVYVIPHDGSANSRGNRISGALLLWELLTVPVATGFGPFHIPAVKAEAQWTLSAPGGAAGFMLQRTIALAVWGGFEVMVGLIGASVLGHGRGVSAYVILPLLAAVTSCYRSNGATLGYSLFDSSRKSKGLRFGIILGVGALLLPSALGIGWSGALVQPFGLLVRGRSSFSTWTVLAAVCGVAAVCLVSAQRRSEQYVELMTLSGLKAEGASRAARQKRSDKQSAKVAAQPSYEGHPHMDGPRAFAWVKLAENKRVSRRMQGFVHVLFLGASLAVSFASPSRAGLHLALFGLFAPAALIVRPDQLKREYVARAPYPARQIFGPKFLHGNREMSVLTLLAWLPEAWAWHGSIASYALIPLLVIVLAHLLDGVYTCSWLLMDRSKPASRVLRLVFLAAAVAIPLGVRAGFGSFTVGASAVLAGAMIAAVSGFFVASVRLADDL